MPALSRIVSVSLPFGAFFEPVVDDGTFWRVLAGVEEGNDVLAVLVRLLVAGTHHAAEAPVRLVTKWRGISRPALVAESFDVARLEDSRRLLREIGVHLIQRRDVIQHPERATVGSGDQVGALHDQIVNRADRQVALERLPVLAVVERDVDTLLGPGVEQPLLVGIFADGPGEVVLRNPVRDLRPRLAVVVGLVEVRRKVIMLVARRGDVGGLSVVRRDLDDRDQCPLQPRDADLGPLLATLGGVDSTIVRPGPEEATLVRRLDEGEDRPVRLSAGVVAGDRPTGRLQCLRVVVRQIRARGRPTSCPSSVER